MTGASWTADNVAAAVENQLTPHFKEDASMKRLLAALLVALPVSGVWASETQLKQIVSLSDVHEQPLNEVLQKIAAQAELALAYDTESIAETGVGLKTPVTCSLPRITAGQAFDLLEPLGLTIQATGRAVVVSRERSLEITYPVADLVTPVGSDPSQPPDFSMLLEVITTTIEPGSWDEVGGKGSVKPIAGPRHLVIRQSAEVHAEIADLFGQLRRLGNQQHALQTKVTITAGREPLAKVLAEIAQQSGLNIYFSPTLPRDRGITADVLVTVDVQDVAARDALSKLLRPAGLSYRAAEAGIVVISIDEAYFSKTYDVAHILAFSEQGGSVQAKFEPLIDRIRTEVLPTSWKPAGAAAIAAFETNLSLVISQTDAGHEQVAEFLSKVQSGQ